LGEKQFCHQLKKCEVESHLVLELQEKITDVVLVLAFESFLVVEIPVIIVLNSNWLLWL